MEIQAIFTERRLNHWAVTTSDGRLPVNLGRKRLHSNACRFASSLTMISKFRIQLFTWITSFSNLTSAKPWADEGHRSTLEQCVLKQP